MGIVFDDALITGNELIDTQHKELIDRVNKLAESCAGSKEKNAAIQTLDFLMDYTEFHFGAEESLQKEVNYPEFVDHKKQHEIFVQSVKELQEMLVEEEGPSDAFVKAVNVNISDWLKNHIQVCDKKLADYIRDRQ